MTQIPDEPIQTYWKMSRDDLSDYWLDAYGWIACYFAQLEGLAYALVSLLGANKDKAQLKKLPFQDRTELARALVTAHLRTRGETVLVEEWDAFLSEAKSAAPLRNKILHNPLTINLAMGDPLHDKEVGIVLVHEPGQPVLKLGSVQAYAKSMLDLNIRLQDLLTRSKLIQESTSRP